MDKKTKKIQSKITPKEAEIGIYIDFEGFVDQSPSMLGILIEDEFEQVVFDQALYSAAMAKGLRMNSFESEMQALIDRAKLENRPIIAYTQHEFNVVKKYAKHDIAIIYRDARLISKKWRKRFYPDSKFGNGLKDFLAFIGFKRPKHLGEKKSTSRIKSVRNMLLFRERYELLTPVAKAKWTKLLHHNEIDCRGMRALINKVAFSY